ncbi:MAG: META domain-containing protein, partial [Henriciella sp.]
AESAAKPLTLRARIDDAAGTLLWTSDTAYPFDLSDGDHAVGEVMLAPTSAVMIDIDDITGREWMVATMNGEPLHGTSTMTMNFEEGGRLNGSAGCNSYTGSYKLNAGKLTTGPIAMTRKACFGPLMEQEQAFTAILGATPRLSFNGAEALLLRTEDGRTVVAR